MQLKSELGNADEFVSLQVKSSTLKRLIAESQLHLDEIQCRNKQAKNTVLNMLKQVLLQH